MGMLDFHCNQFRVYDCSRHLFCEGHEITLQSPEHAKRVIGLDTVDPPKDRFIVLLDSLVSP